MPVTFLFTPIILSFPNSSQSKAFLLTVLVSVISRNNGVTNVSAWFMGAPLVDTHHHVITWLRQQHLLVSAVRPNDIQFSSVLHIHFSSSIPPSNNRFFFYLLPLPPSLSLCLALFCSVLPLLLPLSFSFTNGSFFLFIPYILSHLFNFLQFGSFSSRFSLHYPVSFLFLLYLLFRLHSLTQLPMPWYRGTFRWC